MLKSSVGVRRLVATLWPQPAALRAPPLSFLLFSKLLCEPALEHPAE
jgi:hypothetical protein